MKIDMSKVSKKSRTIAAVAFILGASAIGAGVAQAASTTTSGTNHTSALVAALAQKFNLNSSDVQAVVTQVMADQKTQMMAQHEQNFANRLSKAVAAGKLTQAQADLITAKKKEVATFMTSLKDKTAAERKTALTNEMASLKQWAADNKIDQAYLMFGGMGGGMGHKKAGKI